MKATTHSVHKDNFSSTYPANITHLSVIIGLLTEQTLSLFSITGHALNSGLLHG
jgi:hypothetical protein